MYTRSLLIGIVTAATALLGGPAAPTAASTERLQRAETNQSARQDPLRDVYRSVVSLQRAGRHYCGGVLITPSWVVASRACVQGVSPQMIHVRVGSNRTKGGVLTAVTRIVPQPGRGDIALIELARAVPRTRVTVAAESPPPDTDTLLVAWGYCQRDDCDSLRHLPATVVSDERCSEGAIEGQTEICTRPHVVRVPNLPCYGDVGTPQVIKIGHRWELIGVLSRPVDTRGCGITNVIYTDLPAHRGWIERHTGPLAQLLSPVLRDIPTHRPAA
ncbi:hypothetical protein GCM10012275_34890 [Longimycelium tulufanense]|uniref:Peptidase S1 domain-containing protein n=1 Tax=Longimycelium tulufanense TaxID=907463 RepID=A0A8J3CH80_9PSEU|nr:trypsin-like serine protease [Longimycelium tulufanense]GGM60863.1 hypothetical protein GCM10012275_34890 [Longimycelium tulufanense]